MRNADKNLIIVLAGVFCLFLTSFVLNPQPQGDSFSYLEAIDFLKEGVKPEGLVFNRIITTFGGLWTIILLSGFSGSVLGSWFALNTFFYFLTAIVFYKILVLLFDEGKAAILGVFFFAGNYAILRFGLNFLMDLGGWTFYIFSLFFVLKYAKFGNKSDIMLASLMVGIGGLFKEYAFLGIIPIAAILIYENRNSFLNLLKAAALPSLVALIPIISVYLHAYFNFGYTYLDWFNTNQAYYHYDSRIIEYIKSFGSLLNFLGVLFAGGLVILIKERELLEPRIKLFLFSIFVSFLPVFFWPAITQRLLFISVPFVILVSCFLLKKQEKHWYTFIPILFAYIAASLFMDSFILKSVNLPF